MKKVFFNSTIPYFIATVGTIAAVVANCIKYLTISNFLFSRRVSVTGLIMETLNDPDTNLSDLASKIIFFAILVAVGISILSIFFAVFRKMKAVIPLSVLGVLPFLVIGDAYIHYVGFGLAMVGAIWFIIVDGKENAKMALITCPSCGKQISDKSEKCVHCGAKLVLGKMSATCKECGAILSEGDTICPDCGCPVGGNFEMGHEREKEHISFSESTKSRNLIVIAVAVAIIAIAAVVIVITLTKSNTSSKSPEVSSENLDVTDSNSKEKTDTSDGGSKKSEETKFENQRADTDGAEDLNAYEKIIENATVNIENAIGELNESFEELKSQVVSYDSYVEHFGEVENFYDSILEQNEAICTIAYKAAADYAKEILATESGDDAYDAADGIDDEIYDDLCDLIEDGIYDDFFDELEDYFYEGVLDDSDSSGVSYSDWYDTHSHEYKQWYDTRSDVYEEIYDTKSDIYGFYYDIASDLYSGDKEAAQKTLERFEKKIDKREK